MKLRRSKFYARTQLRFTRFTSRLTLASCSDRPAGSFRIGGWGGGGGREREPRGRSQFYRWKLIRWTTTCATFSVRYVAVTPMTGALFPEGERDFNQRRYSVRHGKERRYSGIIGNLSYRSWKYGIASRFLHTE